MSSQHDGRRPVSRFAADDPDVIVIIGSGAGGGTLAAELCLKGAKAVLLEAGKHYQPEDFINDEWASLNQLAWLDERTTSGSWRIAREFPNLPAWTCKAVGGTTVPWIRHKHSDGRACYQRKLAEGKTRKEALRCLKRRISDAICARLRADARKAGPGGQPGNDTGSSVTGSHPGHRLFGQATSGPEPSLRAPATFTQATPAPEPSAKKIQRAT